MIAFLLGPQLPIPHGEWCVRQREYAACTAELRELKEKLGLA